MCMTFKITLFVPNIVACIGVYFHYFNFVGFKSHLVVIVIILTSLRLPILIVFDHKLLCHNHQNHQTYVTPIQNWKFNFKRKGVWWGCSVHKHELRTKSMSENILAFEVT